MEAWIYSTEDPSGNRIFLRVRKLTIWEQWEAAYLGQSFFIRKDFETFLDVTRITAYTINRSINVVSERELYDIGDKESYGFKSALVFYSQYLLSVIF